MNETKQPEAISRNVLLILLAVCLAAIGAVVYLVLRPGEKESESIITLIETKDVEDTGVNVMHVVDTMADAEARAEEGRRFKVLITDETKAGASGIARIGGMVTFVPNTRKGDVAIVEVTRVKSTTADAVVVERLESGREVVSAPPPRAPREERTRVESGKPSSEMVGKVFKGTVTDMGREGDGVVKVDGKIVFVVGASLGDHVEFRVTDDAGRFARGEVVAKLTAPPDPEPKREAAATKSLERQGQPVKEGEEHVVTVTEADRRNPDVNGVARIDNFVVFVPGAKPGDRVKIRINEVRSRSATSEVLERLGPEAIEP